MNLWQQTAKTAAGGAGSPAAAAHRSPLLHWLVSLGGLGIFGVAIVDSSVIPLPVPGSTDLLLLLLAADRRTTGPTVAWLAFCAFAGSMIGGYLAWSAGRKGGEAALARYVPSRYLARVRGWIKRYGAWSVGISAILPPPVPLTPSLLAAGALGMTRGRFLISYGIGRVLRYSLLAWLGVTYGRYVLSLWQRKLSGWSTVIVWAYLAVVALGLVYSLWKRKIGKMARRESRVAVEETS